MVFANRGFEGDKGLKLNYEQVPSIIDLLIWQVGAKYINPIISKLYRLRQGKAMLEWADSLYRMDETSSRMRARELYKDVLCLHGKTPDVAQIYIIS